MGEEEVLHFKVHNLEDDVKDIKKTVRYLESTINRLELSSTKDIGEHNLHNLELKNLIYTTSKDLRMEMSSIVEPLTNSISVLQTKSALYGAIIGFVGSTIFGGFISLLYFWLR